MRTLAVIPARLGATRLPRKPMRLLAGLPLVVRVWERVTTMDLFDKVIVATDSEEVEDAVVTRGGEVARTLEHNSGTERAAYAASLPAYSGRYDVVVNVQGDEPFVSRRALVGATQMITELGYEIGTAAVPAPPSVLGDPNVVKVVTTARGQAMYFSRAPIPFFARCIGCRASAFSDLSTPRHLRVHDRHALELEEHPRDAPRADRTARTAPSSRRRDPDRGGADRRAGAPGNRYRSRPRASESRVV